MADEITAAPVEPLATDTVSGVDNTEVSLEIGVANMESISSDPNPTVILVNPNDVNFRVKYKKDYPGEKTMPEGLVVISKESAEHFEAIGIGKTV